jgi:hypothetical protein
VTEENKYLDELFQAKFAGFEAEPPASAWNNIHDKLHGNKGGSVNPVNLSMLAALIVISGLLGFSIIGNVPEQSNEIDPAYLSDLHISSAIPSENNFNEPGRGLAENTGAPIHISADAVDSKPVETNNSQPEPDRHEAIHSNQANTVYTYSFAEKARLAKMKNRRSLNLHAGLSSPGPSSIMLRDSKTSPRFSAINKGENDYKRNASWQVGAFFTPEVGFFTDDSIPNQRIYTFDVTARWKKNEFFVESGLGISFSNDDGKYAIDYEQFLGTYDDVYNVTFDTTQSGDIIANYYTNEVNVYDSISKYKVDQTQNKYTYLQIPVYIGFHRQMDRFGWFIKGGPILSLMMNKNIPEPDAGYNRIVGLDQQMAQRVDIHWQMAFSMGITYQLSEKVSIALEPTFRYYLNSQYERTYITTRHPYSLGLRTGLLFNF